MRFYLLALALCPAAVWAAVGARPVSSERLRYRSLLPSEWAIREEGAELSPRTQPDPKAPLGIDVRFYQERTPNPGTFLKERAQARKRLAFRKGRRQFSQGRILRVGNWQTLQTREAGRGASLHTVFAVQAVYGGFYEAVFSARAPWFEREEKTFEQFLLNFRVRNGGVSFENYISPDKSYTLGVPAEPWLASYSPSESFLRVIGPAGPAGGGRAVLSVRYFNNGSFFKDASAYIKSLSRSSETQRPGRVVSRKIPAGWARMLEVERTMSPEDYPDAGMIEARTEKTAYAVLERGGGFYILSYRAPLSDYPVYLPVFTRAYTSFSSK
jgi:hypothetical protein